MVVEPLKFIISDEIKIRKVEMWFRKDDKAKRNQWAQEIQDHRFMIQEEVQAALQEHRTDSNVRTYQQKIQKLYLCKCFFSARKCSLLSISRQFTGKSVIILSRSHFHWFDMPGNRRLISTKSH